MERPLEVVRPAEQGPEQAARTLVGALAGAGFAYLEGPEVPVAAAEDLLARGRRFFALPEEEKETLAMEHGGRAWRGWFPLGGELTSGRPDRKEGLYFGRHLGPEHPAVRAGRALHGPNLLPPEEGWGRALESYLDALTELGLALLGLLERGLGLQPGALARWFAPEPLVLLRLFRYPGVEPHERDAPAPLGVGEHTDYGFLTLLYQDPQGGLEVRTPDGWRAVPPRPGSLVVNVGDMLERATGGRLRSTAHRVRYLGTEDRLTLPFFFDPHFGARVRPLFPAPVGEAPGRWDGEDPLAFEGTYGEYLVRKVTRVFPHLGEGLGGGADGVSQSPGPRE